MKTLTEEEYNFDYWTAEELFNHLIDLHQIPYEEEFDNWRYLKKDMIRICKEGYEHSKL